MQRLAAALLAVSILVACTTPAAPPPETAPQPSASPSATTAAPEAELRTVPLPADRQIMKLQAGLRAFGNDDMEVDGILGARTRAAINEFQALFGLPETGEPDEAVYAKMREIGLTN